MRISWPNSQAEDENNGASTVKTIEWARRLPKRVMNGPTRLDTWAKVKGLAKFADEHGMTFGRLMVGRKVGHTLQVIDVVDRQTREKARKMEAPADLQVLFTKIF